MSAFLLPFSLIIVQVFHSGSLQADLAGNPITGRGLTHLRKCVKLKKLTLSSNPADAFDENSSVHSLCILVLVGT